MQQIKDAGYDKAIFYQNVELVNYLKSFVNGCNRHRKGRISESIDELQQELKDPMYRNIAASMKSEKMKIMAEMLEKGDASGFWSYVTEQNKQGMSFQMKLVEFVYSVLPN